MSEASNEPSEDVERARQIQQKVKDEYAKICSACIDAAVSKYGFVELIKDLQNALKAGYSRRTHKEGDRR